MGSVVALWREFRSIGSISLWYRWQALAKAAGVLRWGVPSVGAARGVNLFGKPWVEPLISEELEVYPNTHQLPATGELGCLTAYGGR